MRRILAYDSLDFDEWLAVLRHGLVGSEVDRTSRAFREAVESEWQSSVEWLSSLRADQLRDEQAADDLVFDLYEMPAGLRQVVDAEYE